jgi:hypothetical protein
MYVCMFTVLQMRACKVNANQLLKCVIFYDWMFSLCFPFTRFPNALAQSDASHVPNYSTINCNCRIAIPTGINLEVFEIRISEMKIFRFTDN